MRLMAAWRVLIVSPDAQHINIGACRNSAWQWHQVQVKVMMYEREYAPKVLVSFLQMKAFYNLTRNLMACCIEAATVQLLPGSAEVSMAPHPACHLTPQPQPLGSGSCPTTTTVAPDTTNLSSSQSALSCASRVSYAACSSTMRMSRSRSLKMTPGSPSAALRPQHWMHSMVHQLNNRWVQGAQQWPSPKQRWQAHPCWQLLGWVKQG